MRRGVRVGIDVGRVRVGLSRSDPDGLLATPLETVPRDDRGVADLDRIVAVVHEHDALEVVVGLPISLSGADSRSTGDARDFAERLAGRLDRPVRLVDERLSTVSAQGALRSAGRSTRGHRPIIDQVAAVIILQHTLDTERMVGSPPGSAVTSPGGS